MIHNKSEFVYRMMRVELNCCGVQPGKSSDLFSAARVLQHRRGKRRSFYLNLLVSADADDEAPQHAQEEEMSSWENIDTRAAAD